MAAVRIGYDFEELLAEVERLRAGLEQWQQIAAEWKAEADRLRATLEAVEWSGPPHTWIDERDEWCMWCGNYRPDGHRADCHRQIALGVAP